jgi:pyruvate,water dikinase
MLGSADRQKSGIEALRRLAGKLRMTDLRTFPDIRPTDTAAVGGKALSLGLLAAAGLPVPPGFCLTTAAHRRLRGRSLHDDPALVAAIAAAYRDLGGGPVAVRSSATAEDSATASFAGQQETVLGVEGTDELCRAIERCWASLDSDRAVAYRRQQGLGDEIAMAVVVQRLVPAEAAGVLFTRDPLDPGGTQMLVEASWGLGESVVSGKVQPDRFHLDRQTGRVLDRHISVKTVQRTRHGEEPVAAGRQGIPSLDESQLAALAELGRAVEALYQEPRDVEWALADGKLWLLQARPITAGGQPEREQVRREEIAALTARAEPHGTVWSRFNLAEVLPEPTPMTWEIVRRYYMAGKGGFGLMYRDLGYDPHPSLDEEGVFDLVCGRPYCNLSREPRLHSRHIPFEHPFALLKADPQRCLYPAPIINPRRFRLSTLFLMPVLVPWLFLQQVLGGMRRQNFLKTFPDLFRTEIAPAFHRETEQGREQDLQALDDTALLKTLDHWARRTLVDFARDGLKPTALAAISLARLEQKLAIVLGHERAAEMARSLVMGVHPDPEADMPGAVADLAAGRLSRDDFLTRFGHRGPEEMELSVPRWSESPELLERPPGLPDRPTSNVPSAEERLSAIPRLAPFQRDLLLEEVRSLHTCVALRETAKHHLMYGHALIRRVLVEMDRRGRLQGGIFFLLPEELPRLLAGEDLSAIIAQRRRRRAVALGLEVPQVIYSDELEVIGRPLPVDGGDHWQGVPLSAGVAEAPALVLDHPHTETAPGEGYILVCPSTDPAWVPLFVRARGLVMETGGVLSHGAIVAREFGLPAVAGLPGVLRNIRTGQRVRVDGGRGTVRLVG